MVLKFFISLTATPFYFTFQVGCCFKSQHLSSGNLGRGKIFGGCGYQDEGGTLRFKFAKFQFIACQIVLFGLQGKHAYAGRVGLWCRALPDPTSVRV